MWKGEFMTWTTLPEGQMLYNRKEVEEILDKSNQAMKNFAKEATGAAANECMIIYEKVKSGEIDLGLATEGSLQEEGFLMACEYLRSHFLTQYNEFKESISQ